MIYYLFEESIQFHFLVYYEFVSWWDLQISLWSRYKLIITKIEQGYDQGLKMNKILELNLYFLAQYMSFTIREGIINLLNQ